VDALNSKVIASGEDEEVSTFAPVKAYLKTLAQGAENFNKVKLMFVGVLPFLFSTSHLLFALISLDRRRECGQDIIALVLQSPQAKVQTATGEREKAQHRKWAQERERAQTEKEKEEQEHCYGKDIASILLYDRQ